MIWRAQLLLSGDADCFFIVQPRCNLGPGPSFGIIAAPFGGHRVANTRPGAFLCRRGLWPLFIDSIFCRGLPATGQREGKGPVCPGPGRSNPGVRGRCRGPGKPTSYRREDQGVKPSEVAAQISQREEDERWMRHAMAPGSQGRGIGEDPGGRRAGAGDKIVAEGWNRSISEHDACAHAEVMALREAGKQLENHRLLDTTLCVTLEPCCMCAGALIHSRVKGWSMVPGI